MSTNGLRVSASDPGEITRAIHVELRAKIREVEALAEELGLLVNVCLFPDGAVCTDGQAYSVLGGRTNNVISTLTADHEDRELRRFFSGEDPDAVAAEVLEVLDTGAAIARGARGRDIRRAIYRLRFEDHGGARHA